LRPWRTTCHHSFDDLVPVQAETCCFLATFAICVVFLHAMVRPLVWGQKTSRVVCGHIARAAMRLFGSLNHQFQSKDNCLDCFSCFHSFKTDFSMRGKKVRR
jgi:hypothetical protein